MSFVKTLIGVTLIALVGTSTTVANDKTLSLINAVEIALSADDPSIGAFKALADSESDNAVALNQLPDPVIKFGVANIATNSFDFSQETMTQMQFGLHQSFPTSKKRALRQGRGEDKSAAYSQMARARELTISLNIRKLWFQIHYLETLGSLVKDKRTKMAELLKAVEASFEGGKSTVQRMISIEAELALLEDRQDEVLQKIATARVLLARYIGEDNANRALAGSYESLKAPKPVQILEEGLTYHPIIEQETALIRASDKSIALAKEDYKPDWGIDLGYGYRAGGRSDMATALVTFDMPLFTAKRQDKSLSAVKKSKQAAVLRKRAKELDMLRDVRASFTVWTKSGERIDLYNRIVLNRTNAASEASENAYATGTSDFAEIIRTHLSELDARMKLEAIRLERASAHAELVYFEGVPQ